MTPPDPHHPPPAPLAYHTASSPDELHYGRADRMLLIFCVAVAGANVSLAGAAHLTGYSELNDLWVTVEWAFFAAHLLAWLVGQVVFWTRRPDVLPPVSAFTLACVAAVAAASLVGNRLYTFSL